MRATTLVRRRLCGTKWPQLAVAGRQNSSAPTPTPLTAKRHWRKRRKNCCPFMNKHGEAMPWPPQPLHDGLRPPQRRVVVEVFSSFYPCFLLLPFGFLCHAGLGCAARAGLCCTAQAKRKSLGRSPPCSRLGRCQALRLCPKHTRPSQKNPVRWCKNITAARVARL